MLESAFVRVIEFFRCIRKVLKMKSQKLNWFFRLLVAFAMISAVGTVLGFFGKLWWVFEAVSSFRIHFFLLLLAATPLTFWKKDYARSAVFCVLAAVNFFHFVPFFLPQAEIANAGKTVRVVSINVHTGNKRWELVAGFIASNSPEIVLLTEVNEDWLVRLKNLEKDYPCFISKPRSDNFGIALFSRIAPDRLEILDFLSEEIPSILMTFHIGSSPCTLLGTHPLPPRNYEYSVYRNAQLKLIGAFFKKVQGEKILLGDMNTTPWSSYFKDLLLESGLKDSGQGLGLSVTWPVHAWWLLGIPIDHCLLSPALSVKHRQVGPGVGSDHYPVLVDISFP